MTIRNFTGKIKRFTPTSTPEKPSHATLKLERVTEEFVVTTGARKLPFKEKEEVTLWVGGPVGDHPFAEQYRGQDNTYEQNEIGTISNVGSTEDSSREGFQNFHPLARYLGRR